MNTQVKLKLKKYLKYLIIILIIVIIYVIFAFKINGKTPISNLTDKYLIVDNYLIMKYENNKWTQINSLKDEILENEFTVYDGLSKKENLTMKFASNKWFFLKNDYDEEDVSNFRYAFTGFDDIKPANYSWQFYDSTDSEYLLSYLNSNDAGLSSSFEPYTSKITYDFNNDGKEETIYTTTNVNLSEDVKKKFSGIFMVSDKKITNIESNSDSPYQVREILDLDNDNEYEMIVSKGTIDVPTFDACYQIYKLQDNKWNIIKDCD